MTPEPRPEQTPTVVVAAHSRAPRNWTALVLVLLALAILKPWGSDDAGGPAPPWPDPAVSRSVPGPSPTPDLSAEGLAEPLCLGPASWLVASVEQWRTHPVRVWKVIEPLAGATGPADPAIPSVPVVAYGVPALGWCAPVWGPLRPVGPVEVTAWRIVDGLPASIDLRQIAPVRLTTKFGALYGPPVSCREVCLSPIPGSSPSIASWLPGRYVFRYRDLGEAGTLWFAVELEQLPPMLDTSPPPTALP